MRQCPSGAGRRARQFAHAVLGVAACVAGAATLPGLAGCQAAAAEPPWRADVRAARAARRAGDDRLYKAHIEAVYSGLDRNPLVLYDIAGVNARLGDTSAALVSLRGFAAAGMSHDVAADTDFRALRGTPGFETALAQMASNRRVVSTSDSAFALSDTALLTEDIAYDPTHRDFFVSSVHQGKIIRIDANGRQSDFIAPHRDSLWGVFALAVDARRRVLWATTAAIPQAQGYQPADSGRSAVYAFDLTSGRLLFRTEIPRTARGHVLGDVVLSADGRLFVADAVGGGVYRAQIGRQALETIVPPGVLGSPQQQALSDDGTELFVSDYPRGVMVVDLKNKGMRWLAHSDSAAVSGLDGLLYYHGSLIGFQNGTEPQRVVRLTLDGAHRAVTGLDVLEANSPWLVEPTHGVLVGDVVYYIANAQWDRFADDGTITHGAPMQRPLVLRVKLP